MKLHRSRFNLKRPFRLILALVSLVVVVGVLNGAFPASSAPVTSTATPKLTVYQGVITIAPGVIGDSILEVGNAGRDVASTGDIFVRPGGVSGASTNFAQFSLAAGRTYLRVPGTVTAGYLTVSPQDSNNEGGEIALSRSSGVYQDWFLDVFQGSFRFHSATVANFAINPSSTTIQSADIDNGFHGTILRDASGERLRTGYSNVTLDNAAHNRQVAGQFFWGPPSGTGDLFGSLGIGSRGDVASGITLFTSPGAGLQPRLRVSSAANVHVISGSLCFGNTTANCSNTWTGLGGGNLDSTLAAGNTSSRSASLGTTTAPTAKLLVHNAQSGAISAPSSGSTGDAIAVYANSANSAIFVRQDSTSGANCAACFVAPNALGTAAGLYAVAGSPTNDQGIGLYANHEYFVPSGSQQNTSWTRAGAISNDLEIYQPSLSPAAFPNWGFIGDVVKILANVSGGSDGNLTGFPLHVMNQHPNGNAFRFDGGVQIDGAPNCIGACPYARAALEVRNTYTSGAGVSATAIIAIAGSGGIGLDAYGQTSSLRATGNGAGTYAGRFIGQTLIEGTAKKKITATAPANDIATWIELNPNIITQEGNCYQWCGEFESGEDPEGESGQCLVSIISSTNQSAVNYPDWCGMSAFDRRNHGGPGGCDINLDNCPGRMRCLCR